MLTTHLREELAAYIRGGGSYGYISSDRDRSPYETAHIHIFEDQIPFDFNGEETYDAGDLDFIGTKLMPGYYNYIYRLERSGTGDVFIFRAFKDGKTAFIHNYNMTLWNYGNQGIIPDLGTIGKILPSRIICVQHNSDYVKTLLLEKFDYYVKTLDKVKLFLYLVVNCKLSNIPVDLPYNVSFPINRFTIDQRIQDMYSQLRSVIESGFVP